MVSNFSVGLSLQFFKDEKDGKRKYFQVQRHGEQSVVLDDNIVNKFYNEQVVYIERLIENFTSVDRTLQNMNLSKALLIYLYQRY